MHYRTQERDSFTSIGRSICLICYRANGSDDANGMGMTSPANVAVGGVCLRLNSDVSNDGNSSINPHLLSTDAPFIEVSH